MKSCLIGITFMISAMFLLNSCKSSDKEVEMDEIEGYWVMIKAERNGNETETLENAFFDINSQILSHNLNGDTIRASYKIDGRDLVIEDDLIERIQIQRLMSDTLEAQLKISKYNFNFIMKRNVE